MLLMWKNARKLHSWHIRIRKNSYKKAYANDPERFKKASKDSYNANPEKKKEASKKQ